MLLLLLLSIVLFAMNLARRQPLLDARAVWIRASLLGGSVAVGLVEALSLFRVLTPAALGAAWLAVALGAAWGLRAAPRDGFARLWPILTLRSHRLALAGIAVSLALTALVAWITPPQTWDSLTYHMARVAHWVQERGVIPFATGIETQNAMPPGAEFGVLNVFLLGGGDRWVNFVAWSAWVGSVLAASYLASLLGAAARGQAMAAVFAATLPAAIVQATSTMTDLVLGLWVVSAAVEVVSFAQRRTPAAAWFGGLAAGLALLTKPTAAAFLAPLAVWGAMAALRGASPRQAARDFGLALAVVIALNAGAWARNTSLYGSPIASSDRISEHANGVRDLRGLISNLSRNLALQLGTPSPYVNKALALAVRQLHTWIGLDPSDPRTTSAGEFRVAEPSTHENRAANLVHTILMVPVTVALFTLPKRRRSTGAILLAATLAGVVLFSFLFKWQVFGSRYMLPAFLLAAPVAGWASEWLLPSGAHAPLIAALWAASLPWVLANRTRPLLTLPEAPVRSVLTESRSTLLFANGRYLEAPYTEVADRIRAAGCHSVGLRLLGNSAEYPFWVLLGAPAGPTRLEWIVSDTDSARWVDPSLQVCAVICEDCSPDEIRMRGLPLDWEYASLRLYLNRP